MDDFGSRPDAYGFDLEDEAFLADPYPVYRRLRDEAPVHYVDVDDLWVVTRFADVHEALRDFESLGNNDGSSELMSSGVGRRARERQESALGSLDDLRTLRVLIGLDPPEHTAFRRLVARAFTPRAIAELEPFVRRTCERLVDDLDDADARGDADFVRGVAWPLPILVIAELLGVPAERRDEFKAWSDDMLGLVGGRARVEDVLGSFAAMFAFFHEEVTARLSVAHRDLLGEVVEAGKSSEAALDVSELVIFAIMLLVAGNETTTHVLGNGLLAFSDRPQAWSALKDRPDLVPSAVEEMLRFDSSVNGTLRHARRDVTLAGVTIPAGSQVLLLNAAANRDERTFPDADRFDVERTPNDHLSFGSGIHLCLGAALARLEARVVLETLVGRFGAPSVRSAPTRADSIVVRGVSRLPVTFRR